MASSAAKVRYVRCPKCLKLLIEFSDVPIYQCGGCSALLQAKYSNNSKENGTLGSLEISHSLKLPGDGSSDNGSSSSEADHGGDHAALPNISPSFNDEHNSHQKGESSETEENGIKVESIQTESQPNESIQTESENCLNEDAENFVKRDPRNSDSLVLSDKSEQPANQDVASEENLVDRTHGDRHDHCFQSPSRSSRDYNGSVSSSDHGSNGCVHDNDLPSSTITPSSMENIKKNDFLLRNFQDLLSKSSNGRRTYSFDSNRAESSSSHRVRTQERGTSLDSADFHSVQNWMGSANLEHSSTLSNESTFHGGQLNYGNRGGPAKFKHHEQDHTKLLRMVDELRDQVSELYDNKEGKRRSYIRRNPHLYPHGTFYESRTRVPQRYKLSQLPPSGQPCRSCSHRHLDDRNPQFVPNFCHNGPCRACADNMWRHPSEAANPHLPPYCTKKVQGHEVELEKSHHKEKRQPSKRHCRPFSGAAPFVICYKCLKLLQLPADFLESRKRTQKLQCGACSQVLLFSFRSSDRTTQTSIEVCRPQSEVDEISFSEEYGLFNKSYSSVAEAVLNDSRNSFEERDGKQAPSSALHHLMGYSSATEILYQPSDNSEGYESPEPTRPHSHRPFEESHVSMD